MAASGFETAATILVKTIFDHNDALQNLLKDHVNANQQNPQAAADFLRPWYGAALTAIMKERK